MKIAAKALLVIAGLFLSTATLMAAGNGKTGAFKGASDHVTAGKVEVSKDDRGYIVTLSDDFSLDGGPDPQIAFGKGGEFIAGSEIATLLHFTGKQSYRVPPTFSMEGVTQVYIWCTKYSVPLGVATLGDGY